MYIPALRSGYPGGKAKTIEFIAYVLTHHTFSVAGQQEIQKYNTSDHLPELAVLTY